MFKIKTYLWNFVFTFYDGQSHNIWAVMEEDKAESLNMRVNSHGHVDCAITNHGETDSFDASGYFTYQQMCELLELDM